MDSVRSGLALQHRLQDCVYRLLLVHHLSHAQRLQINARPEYRYVQGRVPSWRQRGPCGFRSQQIHLYADGGMLAGLTDSREEKQAFANRKQILWTFSLWLEAVAILPQLFMLQRTGKAETITTHYLFALGIYRALYILNWIWRFFTDPPPHRVEPVAILAGIMQTILYSDFFYLYYTK